MVTTKVSMISASTTADPGRDDSIWAKITAKRTGTTSRVHPDSAGVRRRTGMARAYNARKSFRDAEGLCGNSTGRAERSISILLIAINANDPRIAGIARIEPLIR